MSRPKGLPKTPGSGRQKGTPNVVTRDLKEMVLRALENVGGQDYLEEQARKENPAAFLKLVGQCLPKDLKISTPLAMKISLVRRDVQGS